MSEPKGLLQKVPFSRDVGLQLEKLRHFPPSSQLQNFVAEIESFGSAKLAIDEGFFFFFLPDIQFVQEGARFPWAGNRNSPIRKMKKDLAWACGIIHTWLRRKCVSGNWYRDSSTGIRIAPSHSSKGE